MTKTYQSSGAKVTGPVEVVVPEEVTVALTDVLCSAKEGQLALA